MCNQPCPPGFYGLFCGGACHPICSVEECDPVHGCKLTKEDIIPRTNSDLFQTLNTDINQVQNTAGAYDASSLQSVSHVTEDTPSKNVFNSLHLLLALAGVICLFLFIIVIKLFVKSKSRKEKRGNDTDNKSQFQQQKEIHTSYHTVSESLRTIPVYQPLKAEYDEINDKQIQINTSGSIHETTSDECDKNQTPLKKNIPDTHVNNFLMSCIVLEQNITREDELVTDSSEKGSYIDVI